MKKLILLSFIFLSACALHAQDTSAVNYWTRAGITDSTEQYRTNEFVDSLKSQNIWSNVIAGYLVSPTCYGAAVNNLISSSYQLHGGSPPNYSKSGFDFNGVQQYLQTGIIPNAVITSNNFTIVERLVSTATGGIDAGCSIPGGTQAFYVYSIPTQLRETDYSTTNLLNATVTSGTGNLFFTTSATNSRSIRQNKVSKTTSSVAITGTQPNIEMYLGALNNNGTASNWANRKVTAFFVYSPALTTVQMDKLSDDLDRFNNNVIPGGR